jgi:uncharacterized protein
VSGIVLVVDGSIVLLRGRGPLGRALGALGVTLLIAVVALVSVPAVMATNVPPTRLDDATPADSGVPYEDVTFTTSGGVSLSAWYIPSRNGAAVVLRHGAGSTRSNTLEQALVLERHGYGVLMTDARGHGDSGGRAMDFGWHGDADITAALEFLSSRSDVDPRRLGVVGLSMGGEEAIGAAAADQRIRVVVAEGATGRTVADEYWLRDAYGLRGSVQVGLEWVRYTLTDLLTSAGPPTSLGDAIERSPSTPFLLIAAGNVEDEQQVAERLRSQAPGNVSVWVVPDAGHTKGLEVAPAEWEQRVTEFLDAAIG